MPLQGGRDVQSHRQRESQRARLKCGRKNKKIKTGKRERIRILWGVAQLVRCVLGKLGNLTNLSKKLANGSVGSWVAGRGNQTEA